MTDQDPNAYINSLLASIPGLGGEPQAPAPVAAPDVSGPPGASQVASVQLPGSAPTVVEAPVTVQATVASAPPADDPVAAAMAALGLPANPPASAAPAMPAPHPQDNVSPPEAHALPPSVVEAAGLSADALAASVAARQAAMHAAHAPLPGAVGGPPPTPPAQAAYKFTQQDLETLGRIIGEHVVARMIEAFGAMR